MRRALVVALCLTASGAFAAEQDPGGGGVLENFVQRANAYVRLRDDAARAAPPLKETASPEEITAREVQLAAAIQGARPGAKQGEIFGAAGPRIVEIVRADLARRRPVDRSAIRSEIPQAAVPAVNQLYPETLPLATVPPELLDALPDLPEKLEYRFVGAHLVLRDAEANLVVDVLPDAMRAAG
jgi:hypothetical protein